MPRSVRDQGQLTRITGHLVRDTAPLIRRATTLIHRDLTSYASVPTEALEASVRRSVATAVTALLSGVEPTPEDFPGVELTVRERARQGVPVEDMMRAHRIAIAEVQAQFARLTSLDGTPADVALDGTRLLWALSDAFATRVAQAYRALGIEKALRDTHRRSAFVRAMLSGTLETADLVSGYALYGLDASAHYAAVRARRTPNAEVEELRRSLEKSGSGPNKPALIGILGEDCAGVVTSIPTNSHGAVVGVGATVRLAEIGRSFRTASRVMETACRLCSAGVYGIQDLSWKLAAIGDPEVSSYLVERYLVPLRREGDFGRLLERTVRTYLANGQDMRRTAAELVVHINTLRYRLRRFSDVTRMSLTSTNELVELAWALEVAVEPGEDRAQDDVVRTSAAVGRQMGTLEKATNGRRSR